MRSPAAAALLLALSFAAYWPGLHGAFVSDDNNAIVSNEAVSGSLDLQRIFSTSSWWSENRPSAAGYYRPLVTASFAINHYFGGLDPAGYHAVNVVLHALVSWLVLALALTLGASFAAAWIAAAAFVLMPIHSEAVLWSVGRAELMAAAAFTAALMLAWRYRSDGSGPILAAAALLFFAGMLAKENTATLLALPLLAPLCFPLEPGDRHRDAVVAITLLAALGAYFAVRGFLGLPFPRVHSDLLDNPLATFAPAGRVAGAVSVLGRYLFLILWPHPLSVDYSYNALDIGKGFVADRFTLFALAAPATAGWAAWRYRTKQPLVAFSLLLSAACYSIVSNIAFPIGTIMAERLFYLPSLGICLAVGVGASKLLEKRPVAASAALILIAGAWTGVDIGRSRQWRSATTLFEAAVAAVPDSARAHMELATAYGDAGRNREAAEHFERALAIHPGYAAAAYNLGNMYARNGDLTAAVTAYRRALDANPQLRPAWNNLASVYIAHGRVSTAIEILREAVATAPRSAMLRSRLAEVLFAAGQYQEAVEAYTRLLDFEVDAGAVLFNRGLAKLRWRGCDAALPDYLAALETGADSGPVFEQAGACLRRLGRNAEAEALAARAAVANRDTRR